MVSRVCTICGKKFEARDGRRKICDECKEKFDERKRRAISASNYIKNRRKIDPEFRKKRYEMSNNYRLDIKHKEFRRRAIELTSFGHDIEALTKYLEDNFQLRHSK